MRFASLKETFQLEDPPYLVGIAYETYHEEDGDHKIKRRGWEIPFTEVYPDDIDAYAKMYQIPAKRYNDNDDSMVWENDDPFKDGMTGEESFYLMYVKNLDGSDISKEEFDKINEIISDESEDEWGIRIIPRPCYSW